MDPAARQERLARFAQLAPQTANGAVQAVLAGPRGGVHGLILTDGTSVFFRGPIAHALHQRGIHPGDTVRVTGRGGVYPQGRSVLAEQLSFADGTVVNAPVPSPGQ
jgi:hypothetical protein